MNTKFNEVIITTSDPSQMLGKYLACDLVRKWNEDFINQDNGEVIPIERCELVLEKGTYIDRSNLPQIEFFMQTGGISEVKLSNQRRSAQIIEKFTLSPWVITLIKDKKKIKVLLFAKSLQQAIQIITDYIELTYEGLWEINQIKTFTNCIYIDTDKYKSTSQLEKEEDNEIKSLYLINGLQSGPAGAFEFTFLLSSTDVEEAKKYITLAFADKMNTNLSGLWSFDSVANNFIIKSATITSINKVVSFEFSNAYINDQEGEN